MKLRSYLILLIFAALLPVIPFAGVMIYISYQQQRANIERGMIDTARALSLAVDRELLASIRTLQALGASEHLEARNLKQFYEQAGRVLKTQSDWTTIVLFDSDERQVLNLLRPFGSPLPMPPAGLRIRDAVGSKRPLVSDLFFGRVARELRVAVAVPVIQGGEVKYILAAPALPAFLVKLLKEQNIPEDWLATVIDRNKIIIARTREADKFVGQPGTPKFAAESARAEEGSFWDVTKENIPVYAAFMRSRLSGWTVGLGIPAADIEASLARSLMLMGIGGLLLLAGGIFLAAIIGRRISRSAVRLSAGARALGRGEMPRLPPSSIAELNEAAREIETAAVNRNGMETALRQSEQRLKTIIAAEPECVKVVAPDGRILEMNPAGLAMLEAASLEEVQSRPLLDFIAPEYRSAFGELHQRVMEGENGTLAFEVVGLKGTRRWLDTHAVPLRDAQNKIVALLGITRDITAQKKAEEETQRNLRHIEALREIERAITSSLDLRSVLHVLLEKIDLSTRYAAATVRLVNRETGELEPVASRNIDTEKWKKTFSRVPGGLSQLVLKSKRPVIIADVRQDPRTRHQEFMREHGLISFLGMPLIAKDEALGVLAVFTKEQHRFDDEEVEFLTTLGGQAAIAIHNAQIYEEMVRANKVKEEFLGVMSHELRTPLSVVIGYAGMLKEGMLGEVNPQQQEVLQKILSRAADQLQMIKSIMQTTQLEMRALMPECHPVNLPELLTHLRSDLDMTHNKKEVALVWDYPLEPVHVVTDIGKLRQIMQNLIGNALKFTDRGSVTVSARLLETDGRHPLIAAHQLIPDSNLTLSATGLSPEAFQRYLQIKVSDTGIGIDAEQLRSIFDKFFQVDSSESRLYGGVGLGLYIVKTFTELLGGKVEVESRRGSGTTFTVTIPIQTTTLSPAAAAS